MNKQQQLIIEEKFGAQVAGFLNKSQVPLKTDQFGSFSLPQDVIKNRFHQNLLKRPAKKLKCQKKEESLYPSPETADLDRLDNFNLFTNFRRSVDLPCIERKKNPEPEPIIKPITKISQVVSTGATEKKIKELIGRNLNERKSSAHKSSTFYSRRDKVFKEIIDYSSPEYRQCAQSFLSITELFAKKHRQFQYRIFLDSIPQDRSVFDAQLTQDQVHFFFSKVLCTVVPDELFGSRKNRTKIRNTVKLYFESGNEEFTLKNLLNSLNINSIKWLEKVYHESSKIYLLAQVLNWFFDKFIWNIIYAHLYCEKIQSANYEKRLFRGWVRKGITFKYMLNQVQDNVYEPIPSDQVDQSENSRPIPRLWFYAKKSGLRPVMCQFVSLNQKEESRRFQNILKRLHLLHNPSNLRISQEISDVISDYNKNNPRKPLFFVSCDIKDAYGSIIQKKLLEIVYRLVDRLPDELNGQWISLIKSMGNGKKEIKDIECIGLDCLPPLVPPGSLYCTTTKAIRHRTKVSKQRLKELIKETVLHKVVRLSNKYFIMRQGIGQGLTMSSVLSEIYYSDMVSQELGKFTESGRFFRYVDDFLYLTDDEELAEEFFELTKTGIPNYNCLFTEEKSQTNLSPYKDKEFSFLGFRYNVETSEAHPEYTSIPVRYVINLEKDIAVKPNDLMMRRLHNHLGWLKLLPFVIDASRNSDKNIRSTLQAAARMSAERCFVLVLNLIDVKSLDRAAAKQIFLDIKKRSVRPLLKVSQRRINNNDREFRIKYPELECIFWSEYLKVFRKNSIVSLKFAKLIKREIDPALMGAMKKK